MLTLAKLVWQIGLLTAFSKIGTLVTALLHLKIPGSILGILLVFALLQLKVLRIEWIEFGANWLLAELLLFFIPSSVGIIQYKNLLLLDGYRVVLIIALSTLFVMGTTGLVAEGISQRRREARN